MTQISISSKEIEFRSHIKNCESSYDTCRDTHLCPDGSYFLRGVQKETADILVEQINNGEYLVPDAQ